MSNDSSEVNDFSDSSDSNDFSMYSLYVGNIFIPVLCLKAYKKLDNLHSSKKFLLAFKILRALLLLQYHAPSFEMLLPLQKGAFCFVFVWVSTTTSFEFISGKTDVPFGQY